MTAIDGSGVSLGLGTVPFNYLTSGDGTPGDKTLHAVDLIANKLYDTPCTGRPES